MSIAIKVLTDRFIYVIDLYLLSKVVVNWKQVVITSRFKSWGFIIDMSIIYICMDHFLFILLNIVYHRNAITILFVWFSVLVYVNVLHVFWWFDIFSWSRSSFRIKSEYELRSLLLSLYILVQLRLVIFFCAH